MEHPSIARLQECRYRWDVPLANDLQSQPDDSARSRLEQFRRRQLATAVRIAPEIMPGVAESCRSALSRLQLTVNLDAYIYSSSEHQAFCASCGVGHAPVLCISSGMVSLLSQAELAFVIGHEVGHFVMGHNHQSLDLDHLDGTDRLNALAHLRASEISADRIGLLACENSTVASRAILKTATGLSAEHLRFDLAIYLDQARELALIGGSASERDATHPMFTVRLRALLWFEMSALRLAWQGTASTHAISAAELDRRVESDLEKTSGFAFGKESCADLRKAAAWALACHLAQDGVLTKGEQHVLTCVCGNDAADAVISFIKSFGLADAYKRRERTLARIRLLPHDLRASWFQELSLSISSALPPDEHIGHLKVIRHEFGLS